MIFTNDILTNLNIIADLILTLMTFVTFDESNYANIEVKSFSYKEIIDDYDINEYYPGVHFDNFNNNSICNISNASDAVKQAKKRVS